ncbi:hypothetical protein ACQY0O_003493 [Thecaphora frezii]
MSSPPSQPADHRIGTSRPPLGGSSGESGAAGLGSPTMPSAAGNPFVESQSQSQRERTLHTTSNRPFPGSNSPIGSPPMSGSATMSRAPSLSNLDISASTSESVLLSIKCPTLVRDSALIRFQPETTVLQIKQSIQRTWPGKPQVQGLRFIRGGRLLNDDETVRDFTAGTDPNEPASVHLVIRPDAWLDPKNRPTPSRRSSYLRQLPLTSPLTTPGIPENPELESASYFTTLPTSVASPPRHQRLSLRTASANLRWDSFSATDNRHSNSTRDGSSVSNASSSNCDTPIERSSTSRGHGDLPWTSSRFAEPPTMRQHSDHGVWDLERDFALPSNVTSEDDHFRQIFMATAPDNYPLLAESARLVYSFYLDQYCRLYQASQKGQLDASDYQSGEDDSGDVHDADDLDSDDESADLARSVEKELFGWEPFERPPLERQHEVAKGQDLEYMYQEVQCNGLPYLLQLAVTTADRQRSAAMAQLLQRMTRLRSIIKMLDSMTRFADVLARTSSADPAHAALVPPSILLPPSLFAQGPAAADAHLQQRQQREGANNTNALQVPGHAAPAAPHLLPQAVRTTLAGMTELTWNEIFSMMVPLFFLGLKLGIMLYVFARGASTLKRYTMMGAAVLYVFWEAFKMIKRRTDTRQAARQRQAAAAAAAAAGAAGAGANQGVAGLAEGVPRPAGANVPHANLENSTSGGGEAEADPLAPLPPVHAPRRFSSANPTLYNPEHWLELLAFIGMDSEDEELGLLPAPGTTVDAPRRRGRVFHLIVVPLVLFFVTLVPEIEMKRRRAIEEREDAVRNAVRMREERENRIRELRSQQQQQQQGQAQAQASEGEEGQMASGDYKGVLGEYSERILRRRRGVGGGVLDGRDAEAIRAAVRADEGDEGEDLQMF